LDKNKNSKDVYSKDVLFWIKTVLNICSIFKHASTQTWRFVSSIRQEKSDLPAITIITQDKTYGSSSIFFQVKRYQISHS
jgi:hypothetical protein